MKKLGLLYGFCRYCPLVGKMSVSKDRFQLVVLPKPNKVKLIENGTTGGKIDLPIFELHNDGGPVFEHPFAKAYYWHNTRVPERMGVTPSKDWSVDWIKDEGNAEVRAILIQEIGIDKVKEMGVVKDSHENYSDKWFSKSEYQLIDMSSLFESIDYAPYLFMRNQTTGVTHMEGVHPDCRSVVDALSFRVGEDFSNLIIGSIH